MRDWLKVMLDEIERKQREADEQTVPETPKPAVDEPDDTSTQDSK
ncbi:MAG: hypothetical protein AAGC71_01475 [Pseudomonadota bacterium]